MSSIVYTSIWKKICISLCMNKLTGKGMVIFKILFWCEASALISIFSGVIQAKVKILQVHFVFPAMKLQEFS